MVTKAQGKELGIHTEGLATDTFGIYRDGCLRGFLVST